MSAQLYRGCKLGDSLVEALDILVQEEKIPGALALRVMQEVRRDRIHGDARQRRPCRAGDRPPTPPAV